MRAALVRERVNSIRPEITGGGPRPIDGTIVFPPVDPTRILQPHRDALILSLGMRNFDMRCILVDPGSSTDLLQVSVVSQMGRELSGLENPGRIFSGFNGAATTSLGDIVLPVQVGPSHSQCAIFGGTRFVPLQCYLGAHVAALYEIHPFYVPSNGKLSH